MSDMFEYLEAQAEEENLPFKNAAIIAIDRAERSFESFVASAKGEKEFWARIAYIQDEIIKIAQDACEEYGYDDPQHVAKLVLGQLELLSARNSDSSDTASIGNIEHQDLKAQDPSGYYTEPTVALNPGSAGDNMHNTNPSISELKPDERQHPDDLSYPNDGALPKANLVDADKPMQPADHHGDSTMTFPNKGQADPVTSSKKKSNSEDLASSIDQDHMIEYSGYHSIMEKINNALAQGQSLDDVWNAFGAQLSKWNISKEDLNPTEDRAIHQQNLNRAQDMNFMRDFTSAERMDFNSLSEMMTPTEATQHLVEAGMEAHEAGDRIDWYVNHVNPGWANKAWTAAAEDEMAPAEESEPDQFGRTLRQPNQEDANEMARVEYFENQQRQRIRKLIDKQKSDWGKREKSILKSWKAKGISQEIIANGLEGLDVIKDENGFTDLDKMAMQQLGIGLEEFEVKGIDENGNVVMGVPSVETGYQKKLKEEQKTINPRTKQIAIGDQAIRNRSIGLPNPGEGSGSFGGPKEF